MNFEQTKQQIRFISSNDRTWEINYFHSQYLGLADLICSEKSNDPKLNKWKLDTIKTARLMRAELIRRFNYVCFGSLLMDRNCNLI